MAGLPWGPSSCYSWPMVLMQTMALRIFLILVLLTAAHEAMSAPVCLELFEKRPTLQNISDGLNLIDAKEKNLFNFLVMSRGGFTPALMEKSFHHPILEGQVSIFHGHLFPEGYFRSLRGFTQQKQGLQTTAELERNEPWLKWDAMNGRYVLKRSDTIETLLTPYTENGQVTLYRGVTSENEAAVLKKFLAGKTSAIKSLFNEKRDAIFLTPDRASADKWAQEYILEMTLDLSQLKGTYAGIEADYVEVAISDIALLKKSAPQMKLIKVPQKN
jgi:hypothetical protein